MPKPVNLPMILEFLKWGKFMRRLWLDEVPQLVNVLKGELKTRWS